MTARIVLLAYATALAIAFSGCTSRPSDEADRDGDGLADALETTPRAITIQAADGPRTRQVTSDPTREDTDDDGLDDRAEYYGRSDASDPDTDGDGLLDGHSVTPASDSPLLARWRTRGILEVPTGTFVGELSLCPGLSGLKAAEASSDRPLPDGLSDGDELRGWDVTVRGETRHVRSDPCSPDGDQDGLLDDREKALGSDPALPDTDGDGARDGQDADALWDLSLAFTGMRANATGRDPVRLTFSVGTSTQSVVLANATTDLRLALDDTGYLGSLPANVLLSATDPDGDPVRLFGNSTGVVLRFELVAGTVDAGKGEQGPGILFFSGEDGALQLAWDVART